MHLLARMRIRVVIVGTEQEGSDDFNCLLCKRSGKLIVICADICLKRMGKYIGKRPDYKKAIVTLQEGETIEFFEGA